ncbi:MAG: hypothetical protein WC889_15625 [Myxococcota bacterium]
MNKHKHFWCVVLAIPAALVVASCDDPSDLPSDGPAPDDQSFDVEVGVSCTDGRFTGDERLEGRVTVGAADVRLEVEGSVFDGLDIPSAVYGGGFSSRGITFRTDQEYGEIAVEHLSGVMSAKGITLSAAVRVLDVACELSVPP